MTRERLEQIFEETDSEWEGDCAYKGLQILSKYTDYLIQGADHDIIYSINVDDICEKITEEDAVAIARLNWMIDVDSDCLACFV